MCAQAQGLSIPEACRGSNRAHVESVLILKKGLTLTVKALLKKAHTDH